MTTRQDMGMMKRHIENISLMQTFTIWTMILALALILIFCAFGVISTFAAAGLGAHFRRLVEGRHFSADGGDCLMAA